jgi:uncharacterized protein with PQ loop repeat
MLPVREQEIYGWIGNGIFFAAQLSQIIYTFRIKSADDLSYTLFFFWLIGECMYTAFGWIDDSPSMFIGNGASLVLSVVQLGQKVHYKRVKENTALSRLNSSIQAAQDTEDTEAQPLINTV